MKNAEDSLVRNENYIIAGDSWRLLGVSNESYITAKGGLCQK